MSFFKIPDGIKRELRTALSQFELRDVEGPGIEKAKMAVDLFIDLFEKVVQWKRFLGKSNWANACSYKQRNEIIPVHIIEPGNIIQIQVGSK